MRVTGTRPLKNRKSGHRSARYTLCNVRNKSPCPLNHQILLLNHVDTCTRGTRCELRYKLILPQQEMKNMYI